MCWDSDLMLGVGYIVPLVRFPLKGIFCAQNHKNEGSGSDKKQKKMLLGKEYPTRYLKILGTSADWF